MRAVLLPTLALALAAGARPAAAQSPPTPVTRRQAIAVNFLGIPFGWLTGEYERGIGGGATVGVGGSYIQPSDEQDNLTSVDAKLRYYPAERGLRGFSLGLTGGYSRIEEHATLYAPVIIGIGTPGGPASRTRVTHGPTVGVAADYNWLLGKRKQVLVGLGVGAKRIFAKDPTADGGDLFDLTDLRAYPTMRFVVGLAF